MVAAHSPREDAPGPFDGLTDAQVLERAMAALRKVQAAPLDGHERTMQWSVYRAYKAELDMRFYRHVLWKIHEKGDRP